MRTLILFFIFLFSILNSYAYEVEGLFENIGADVSIIEGESFNARISLWPMSEESLEEFKLSINRKMFLDHFYIAKVENIQFSENNSEAIVVYVKAVLTKSFDKNKVFIWTYKSLTIPFDIKNISPVKNTLEKKFIILNQKDGSLRDAIKILPYMILLFFVFIIIYFSKKYYENRLDKIKYNEIIQRWNTLFKDVSDRVGIEEVYSRREEWLTLVGGETPPILIFFEELNKIQYKKSWTDIEEHKVLEAYDDIRGIFERA